ncbi:MAG: cytochrome c family protein [Planctomycetota bacterium]
MFKSPKTVSMQAMIVIGLALPIFLGMTGTTGCPVVPPPNGGGDDITPGDTGVTGKFKGAAVCMQCHANIHTDWVGTLHTKALEALEAVGQGSNAACLACHTVGFGQEGGFVDRATTNSLAGVQCESCHGAAGDHAMNASDETLRPKISLSADVCGQCHTGEHQPNFEDWGMSRHADSIQDSHITNWATGGASSNLTSCGKCHSGDYFFHKMIKGETNDSTGKPVDGNYLQGKTDAEMTRVTCVICHNPHAKTGNAATPDDGRDYQLRFPQIKFTTPTSDLTLAQDPTRFNLCGQCHHTRDRVWTDSSREPHPSDQANVFFGEIPSPAAFPDPIVPPRASVHLNAPEQCSTCHVGRKPFEEGVAPAVSGHTFTVSFINCVQCHGTEAIAEAKLNAMKTEFDIRVALIEEALDVWAAKAAQVTWCSALPAHTGPCWEFTSEGGPANNAGGQGKIPNEIKKARYILYYIKEGGGSGAHNPDFVREALMIAEELALNAPDVI